MLQTTFGPSCMNQGIIFEWHKRFKEGRESMRDDERCRGSKEVNRPELIGQRVRDTGYYVEVLREYSKRFKSGQWLFHQDNAPVHKSILVTDYLTKMGINRVPHPPYSPDLASCDFWLFRKLRGCRYETIEAVTKVIDTLAQEDSHGAFQKLLEQYNKCIAAGVDYFGLLRSINNKSVHTKNSGNFFNDPRIYIYIYIYVCQFL